MGLTRNRLVQAGTFLIGLLVLLAVAAPGLASRLMGWLQSPAAHRVFALTDNL